MPLDLDATEVQNEDDVHKSRRAEPGKYHVSITDADDSEQKYPGKWLVTFAILAGTTPGQEKKTHTEFFSLTKEAQPRLVALAMACGLIKPGQKASLDAAHLKNRQLVIELFNKADKDDPAKVYLNATFSGFWRVDHPDVADVPKNQQALSYLAQGQAVASGATAGTTPANGGWDV